MPGLQKKRDRIGIKITQPAKTDKWWAGYRQGWQEGLTSANTGRAWLRNWYAEPQFAGRRAKLARSWRALHALNFERQRTDHR